MSTGFMSGAVNLDELCALLRSQEIYTDDIFCRNVMKKVLAVMNFGQDLRVLSPLMVKLLAHSDLLVKKVACHYLVEYVRGEDEHALLAINTLMTDTKDSNPMTRALALKTLCSLQSETFLEYGMKCLPLGLRDRSAYVRRVAVNCCQRLHAVSPAAVLDAGLVDELYGLIRDSDPIVLVNSLAVLENILQSEGGVVISQPLAHHLLNSLPKLTDWGVITVFSVLSKYSPKTDEERFDIMNLADTYLKNSNMAVTASCLQFFGCLVEEYADLRLEVFVRARDSVLSTLTSGNTELTYTVLQLISDSMPGCRPVFTDHIRAFLCRHNEPPYTKIKRLHLLAGLVTEANMAEVVEELGVSCTDIVTEVSTAAVSKLGDVAGISSTSLQVCVAKLQDLVDLDLGHVLSNVVQVVERLTETGTDELTPIVVSLCEKHSSIMDWRGRASFLNILAMYKDVVPGAAYILEDLIDTWLVEADSELKRSFLTAGLKLFLFSPGTCQDSLGQILETCVTDEDQDVSDTAQFYYRLLQTDVNKAQTILEGTSS